MSTKTEEALEGALAKAQAGAPWTYDDVAAYIGKSVSATKVWLWRRGVRRCNGAKGLTRKEWVDAALNKKAA